jgi:mono/diheme cytochrome c family protein
MKATDWEGNEAHEPTHAMRARLMSTRRRILRVALPLLAAILVGCGSPNPQPAGLTPVPSLPPSGSVTLVPALQGAQGGSVLRAAPTAEDAGAVGAAIYLRNCSPCHGTQGEGVDAPALRNSQFVETVAADELFTTIAAGRSDTEMPAWLNSNGGPLSQGEIAQVIAYLKALQGHSSIEPAPSPTPEPTEAAPSGGPTEEPAKPSGSGGPGPGVGMAGEVDRGKVDFGLYCAACHGPEGVQGIPNPGSDDGSVPPLNPIDSTLISSDYATFATNVDLFIEHGSVPEGEAPQIMMPSFGDWNLLGDSQIADLLAYVLDLNGVDKAP